MEWPGCRNSDRHAGEHRSSKGRAGTPSAPSEFSSPCSRGGPVGRRKGSPPWVHASAFRRAVHSTNPVSIKNRSLLGVFVLATGMAAATPAPGPLAGKQERAAIRLYGIVKQQEAGLALLQFGEGRPLALRVGETHRGFTVLRVLAAGVELEASDGQILELDLPDRLGSPEPGERSSAQEADVGVSPSPEPRSEPELAPADPSAAGAPASAVPRDTGERTFSRDDVRLRLQSELPRILSSAVVAPRVLGNEVVGLELVAFPTDTVLGETGLLPGDVLLAVNGREVRGAESLAVLVQRFQTASQLELSVDRDGEVFPLRYRFE